MLFNWRALQSFITGVVYVNIVEMFIVFGANLDTTYFALLFFAFVTCPCSFRTKRHNNLFVYGDDDDLYSCMFLTVWWHIKLSSL